MKTIQKFVFVISILLLAANSYAGRWLTRDPLEFMERDPKPSVTDLSQQANLYTFVLNNPINYVDPLGLDVWVVQSPSWPGHQWIVGQNPNGSYWDASFHPDTKSGWALNSKGKTDFNPNSGFDPNHLDNGVVMKEHVKTCPDVDAKVKNEAQRRADDPNQPRYDVLGNNCRDFSCGMANYAWGAQLRANMGK